MKTYRVYRKASGDNTFYTGGTPLASSPKEAAEIQATRHPTMYRDGTEVIVRTDDSPNRLWAFTIRCSVLVAEPR